MKTCSPGTYLSQTPSLGPGMQRDFAYGADQHRDHPQATHISRRFTYFGTRSTRLRALIGLDLLIELHLIV